MAKAITEIAIGVGLAALTVFTGGFGLGLATALGSFLIGTSASLVLSGIGSLFTSGPQSGLSSASRNPVAPWAVIYGRSRVGGNIVFIEETGDDNKYLHMVMVLACHPCAAVEELRFDNKTVLLSNGQSFPPENPPVDIDTAVRDYNGVVTLTLASPLHNIDDQVLKIEGLSDPSMNGSYFATRIDESTFTYVCGGFASDATGGTVRTTFADYADTVRMETLLGDHTETFPSLVGESNGLWTADHLLLGHTAVYLRLRYDDQIYSNGLPSISFTVRGKNDIYDPRTQAVGYTANSALVIADYLAQPDWGFRAQYGTEIPTAALIAAANICDEAIPLQAGGVESRYACNGTFTLTTKRGEVLQNMLTSCGGRLSYTGGQFIVHPAAWRGISATANVVTTTVSVRGRCLPWRVSSTLNAAYPFGKQNTGTDPVIVPGLQAGERLAITYQSGTVSIGPNTWPAADADGANCVRTGTSASGLGVYFPTRYMSQTLNQGALCGAFTDAAGRVVQVVAIGKSSTVNVPAGASQLQLGLNDDDYGDNEFGFQGATNAYVMRIQRSPSNNSYGTTPPVLTPVSTNHLAGPFKFAPKLSSRDLCNGVKGSYVSRENNYERSDIPSYALDGRRGFEGDNFLAEDNGERRWLDIQLPFTQSSACAQRLAKIELLRKRMQGKGTFTCNMSMYPITALDIVQLTLPIFQWDDKLFEVASHRFTLTKQQSDGGDATLLGTEIDLVETDPSIYEWSPSEEVTAQGTQQAVLPPRNSTTTQINYGSIVGTPTVTVNGA